MLKTSEEHAKPKEKFFTKKKVVQWVATNSVRFVVVGAINTVVPADTRIQKVRRFIGSHIIADMVAEHVKGYIDREFAEIVDEINEMKDVVNGVVDGEVISSEVVKEPIFSAPEDIVDAVIVEEPATTSTA